MGYPEFSFDGSSPSSHEVKAARTLGTLLATIPTTGNRIIVVVSYLLGAGKTGHFGGNEDIVLMSDAYYSDAGPVSAPIRVLLDFSYRPRSLLCLWLSAMSLSLNEQRPPPLPPWRWFPLKPTITIRSLRANTAHRGRLTPNPG